MLKRCLVLLSKPPVPGRVKTRLHGALTEKQAAELHRAFLEDFESRCEKGSFDLWMAWALEDGEAPPLGIYPVLRQKGSSLGERIFQALRQAGCEFDLIAAVGSDHPELSLRNLELAFDKLEDGFDVVVGPAGDGGYYLIGFRARALDERVFGGVSWSTSSVLSQTMETCAFLGLSLYLLPTVADIDTPADLEQLCGRLGEKSEDACPNTYRLLEIWGFLNPTSNRRRR